MRPEMSSRKLKISRSRETLLSVKCHLRLTKSPNSLPEAVSATEHGAQEASAGSSSSRASYSSDEPPIFGESVNNLEEENVEIG